jgi:ribosome recycling factor
VIADTKRKMLEKMEVSIEHLRKDLGGIRTGRASLSIFDNVIVDYYGTPTPIRQVGTLSVPDPRSVLIQPWETRLIPEIEKGILASGLGLTPTNDGKVIRISIPALTEERRRDLVKLIKKMGEETKVAIRNIRREVNDELKELQKSGGLSEDAHRKGQEEVQKLTDQQIHKVDEVVKKKETEVMEI